MSPVPSFTFGKLSARCKDSQKRDESGVLSAQLVTLLREVGGFEGLQELSRISHIDYRILQRIFGSANRLPEQPWTALLTADRLLTALGAEDRIHDLTILPNTNVQDAIKMATYEFVNCDGDCETMDATDEQIAARAQELIDLRNSMLADEVARLQPQRKAQAERDEARRKRRKRERSASA